jgi:predicted PurR-regulated permease PerM
MSEEKSLDISWKAIFKIGIAIFLFYLIYLIKNILIWFIFALILAILFEPAIVFLEKKGISRQIATFLIYFLFFGILGLSIYLVSLPLFSEIQQFSQNFPQYLETIAPPLKQLGLISFENVAEFIQVLQEWLKRASGNIFSAMVAVFGSIFATFTIFAFSLFISLEEKGIEKAVTLFVPKKYEESVISLLDKSREKISSWFGIKILNCLFVGVATIFTLKLFNISYPITYGLFAGIIDIIPILGPLFAGSIITLSALLDSWIKAIFFLISFILIQQISGNFLTPILAKKFVGLPPILVLMAVLIGGKIWGIWGAILAIPFFGIIYEFLRDFLQK